VNIGKHAALFFGIAILLLSAGCARYSARPLNRVVSPGIQQTQSVACAYKPFDYNDCRTYLGRNVLAKGYQPVNVTIYNNSDRYIKIAKTSINMHCVPAIDVAKTVHTSTPKRAATYGILGLAIWPLLIPAVVEGMRSSLANHKLDDDFLRKELADQTIAPYSSASGVIFITTNEFKLSGQKLKITTFDAVTSEPLVLSATNHLLALNT